jgi:hypothetical protein
MAMSPITGDEIEEMRSSMAEMNRKITPIQWSQRNMIAVVYLLNLRDQKCIIQEELVLLLMKIHRGLMRELLVFVAGDYSERIFYKYSKT